MDILFHLLDQINLHLLSSWWLTLLVGIALCFFGLKIFSTSLFWFGALLGGIVGYGVGSNFYQVIGGVAGAVILGILCGYLFRAVLRIGIFLAGLFIGSVIGTSFLGHSFWMIPLIIGSGIIATVFSKYFIIVATALWGALLLTASIASLNRLLVDQCPLAVITIELVVFLGGLAYQFITMNTKLKSSSST
jgi:hypothetical protein